MAVLVGVFDLVLEGLNLKIGDKKVPGMEDFFLNLGEIELAPYFHAQKNFMKTLTPPCVNLSTGEGPNIFGASYAF